MCKRQAGEKLLEEEKGLEGLIDEIGEDHAKLILDRLELLSKMREIVKHPKLEERLKLCENNLDTPDWWEPGKHDRELVRAVLKYGLYRSDQYILNDSEFPFSSAEKHYVRSLEVLKSFKFDNPADLFKLAMGELPTPPKADTSTSSAEKPVELKKEKEPEKVEATEEKEAEPTPEESPKEEIEAPKSPPKSPEKVNSEVPEEKEAEAEKESEETATPAVNVPAEEKMEVEETPAEEEKPAEEKPVEEMEVDKEKETPADEEVAEPAVKEDEPAKEEAEEKSPKPVVDEEEKMEVSEEKAEAESIAEVIEEKKEGVPSDEEKLEPKVDEAEVPAPIAEIEEAKSPEKKTEEEATEAEVSPVKIKEEPAIERPEGEAKVIDTVVIEDEDTLRNKEKALEASSSNKADELRARFPDLEVFQPLMKLKQLDAMLMKGDVKDNLKSLSRVFDTSMVVKWFRDFALEKRISHIIYCVEKGVWPVGKSYSAYSGCLGIDLDLPLYETVKRLGTLDDKRSSSGTPDIITITTDHHQLGKSSLSALQSQLHQSMSAMASKGKKGQKRHIAIDVETERAKLHALLNNTTPLGGGKSNWNEDDQDIGRRSGGSGLQPPPAHQPSTRSAMSQYKPTVIPGTSSTLTPIDLSSR